MYRGRARDTQAAGLIQYADIVFRTCLSVEWRYAIPDNEDKAQKF